MIVCDIDGTLVMHDGSLNPVLVPLLAAVSSSVPITFLTGRVSHPGRKADTEAQLGRAGFSEPQVMMRPTTRKREAPHVWKIQTLRRLVIENDVTLLIDDDQLMLRAAKLMKVPALHPRFGLYIGE